MVVVVFVRGLGLVFVLMSWLSLMLVRVVVDWFFLFTRFFLRLLDRLGFRSGFWLRLLLLLLARFLVFLMLGLVLMFLLFFARLLVLR